MTGLFAALSRGAVIGGAIVFAVGMNCLGARYVHSQGAPDYAALMAASDRSDADRVADKRRDPVPFIAFAGLVVVWSLIVRKVRIAAKNLGHRSLYGIGWVFFKPTPPNRCRGGA